jgi:hypothetical protein
MNFGDLMINQLVGLAGLLNGASGVSTILADKSGLDTAKYGWMTLGQFEALGNCLGGEEVIRGLLYDTLVVVRVGKTVEIREAERTLFDRNGRRIPPRGMQAAVEDANPNLSLTLPQLNLGAYSQVFDRIQKHLRARPTITLAEFIGRSDAILRTLQVNDQLKKVLNGGYLPFWLPKMKVSDYGQVLDEVFLLAVERSYKEQFPTRPFENYFKKGQLKGEVTLFPGSRHEKLVEAMTQGDVVGVYFPNCLLGYSVDALRAQIDSLPEQFLLAGGLDVCAAMIAYPDVLAEGSKLLRSWLPALLPGQSVLDCFNFGVRCDSLYFGKRFSYGSVHSYYSGGLVVLG